MTPHSNRIINVVIFGSSEFPVLPASFRTATYSQLNDALSDLKNVPAEVIYIGVTDTDPDLMNNVSAFVKHSPGSVLIALVRDDAEAERAIYQGATDYIVNSTLNSDVAAMIARIGIARSAYLKKKFGYPVIAASDLTAIARSLSHEIRNTLSGIVLSLEPIRAACANSEDARSYVEILERASGKLTQVVNRFSLATGNIVVKTQDEDFNEIVRRSLSLLPPDTLKNVQLIQAYSQTSLIVPLDKEKIALALAHLISNAVDSLKDKSDAKIEVTTVIKENGGAVLINDNGHGINSGDLQNVYRPYYSTRSGKVGLGLSIANSIIRAHGGTLSVTSKIEEGTKIECWFPLKT